MSSDDDERNTFDVASDDEDDWEEVDVQQHQPLPPFEPPEATSRNVKDIEITLQPAKSKDDADKKKGISHAERLLRIDLHKIHTVVLLANAKFRNTWLNDELLQARLLSLTPLTLQNEFALVHKSRIPDQAQRGRAFERAISHLVEWWAHTFFEVLPEGHIRNRTFADLQPKLERYGLLDPDAKDREVDEDILDDIIGGEPEIIRGPKSLMKHALNRSGSRDVSSQLFTSLCRALGIPARLVVSLQSMPWKSSVGKPKPTYSRKGKGKGKQKAMDGKEDGELSAASFSKVDVKGKGRASAFQGEGARLDGAPVPKSEKAKGKEKAQPVIRLRKQKDKGNRLDDPGPSSSRLASPDPTTTPPVFWTEVFSRADGRWIPVDPIRAYVNRRKVFDPTPVTSAPGATESRPSSSLFPQIARKPTTNPQRGFKEENRMLYVLAFEEDGYARDVTRRYAREYSAKILKVQGGSGAIGGGGRVRQAWWENVVNIQRDDVEDDELASAQMTEGMPTTIAGFKDHPLYALERHLKQTEAIHPPPPDTRELGKFRGESVYPRSSVVSLKTAETWMRTEGRMIMPGAQPLKTIKARAGTLNKQRELEVFRDELRDAGHDVEGSGADVMQGLYARFQTEVYIPEPIVDGKIPKNNFGNIDLYAPTMLPRGAAHVPFKGVAKIARKLGFDYAEAVTGFEFRKRRANPIVEGVVVAAENESALLQAYWEAQQIEQEKARTKKEEKALQHWMKLVHGLRIRQRLQDQYADRPTPAKASPSKSKGAKSRKVSSRDGGGEDGGTHSTTSGDEGDEGLEPADTNDNGGGGGFLIDAGDVVEAFHLPKYNPLLLLDSSSSNPFAKRHTAPVSGSINAGDGPSSITEKQEHRHPDGKEERGAIDFVTYDLDEEHGDDLAPMDVDEGGTRSRSSDPPITEFSSPISLAGLAAVGDAEWPMQMDEGTGEEGPRTMQDLLDAEEAAKGKGKAIAIAYASTSGSTSNQLPSSSGDLLTLAKGSSGPLPQTVVITGRGESPSRRQLRSGRNVATVASVSATTSPVTNGASRKTRGAGEPSSSKPPRKVAAKKGATAGTRRATKTSTKRKRGKRKKAGDEDEDEKEEEEEFSEGGLDEDDAHVDEDDNSPRKRLRVTPVDGDELTVAGTALEVVAPSSSGRTLRPRRSKTAAQLNEEKEAERAFRKAVAQ